STDEATCGYLLKSTLEARYSVFSSHPKWRSTFRLRASIDSTRASRDSRGVARLSSVKRSSSEGCSRWRSDRSAMPLISCGRSHLGVGPLIVRCRLGLGVSGVLEQDFADVQQRVFRLIGGKEPLALRRFNAVGVRLPA